MFRLILAVATAVLVISIPGCSQPSVREHAARIAGWPMHGFSQLREIDLREGYSRNPRVMRELAQLISEAGPAPDGVDTATVLWWLAENGAPEYLPLFVRFSAEPVDSRAFQVATYGLARHAGRPEAATRLRALAGAGIGRDGLSHVAVVLMYVGDVPARAALRDLPDRQLWPVIRDAVNEFLASPVGEGGRWPCSPGNAFTPGADGRYRCRPTPSDRSG